VIILTLQTNDKLSYHLYYNMSLFHYCVCQGCTGDEREMAKQIASVSPRLVLLSLSVFPFLK